MENSVDLDVAAGLSFGQMARMMMTGNCCVSTDSGEAHQWAQAHILVCELFDAS